MKHLVDTAKEHGKPLSICGEIASDISFLPLLIGLGIEQISVDAHAVGRVSCSLLDLDVHACERVTLECLAASTGREVREILQATFPSGRERHLRIESDSIDPICKMTVHTGNNELVVARGGRRYYFCSRACYEIFRKCEAK